MSTLVVNESTCSQCGKPVAECVCVNTPFRGRVHPVRNRGHREEPLGQPTWNFDPEEPCSDCPDSQLTINQKPGRFGEVPMGQRTWSFD